MVIGTGRQLKETDFTTEGWGFFVDVNQPNIIGNRFDEGFITLGSFFDNSLVGLITLKNQNHITQLFVKKEFQDNGIASSLWALAKVATNNTQVPKTYTVFSSRAAIPVYESFGFKVTEPLQEKNGIYYRPMKYQI